MTTKSSSARKAASAVAPPSPLIVTSRSVTDEDGRVWSVTPETRRTPAFGRDVILLCTTPTVANPVRVKLGWQWIKMAEKGLARLIAAAIPE